MPEQYVDFSEHLFYDRIINVRLIKTSAKNPRIVGFTRPRTQSLIDAQVMKAGKRFDLDYASENIYRLEGYSHKEYSKDVFGGNTTREVVARGPTYKYTISTNSDSVNFRMGRTPSGDPLKDGDRLLVNRDGIWSKYHIVEVSGEQSEYIEDKAIDIICPPTGQKPHISFSVNMIPGQNIYGLNVRITNMNLDIPIREFDKIRITAGYRTEAAQQTFDCDIFSSYMEQPNPDGVAVFSCLIVGKTNVFMSHYPIRVHYIGGECTLGSTIQAVCDALHLRCHNYLLDAYCRINIGFSDNMTTQAANATALLDWLRKIIIQTIKQYEKQADTDPQPAVMLTEEGLFVYCINRANTDTDSSGNLLKGSYTISNLNAIKGAAFNGVALTVKTVWHPELRPGRVFRMTPNIINGANLPNSFTEQLYRGSGDAKDLYRVITVSVSFSTNGEENEMTILAVPLVYVREMSTTTSAEDDRQSQIELLKKNPINQATKEVIIGTPSKETTTPTVMTSEQKQKKAREDLFNIDVSELLGGGRVITASYPQYYCVSKCAEIWYRLDGTTPDGTSMLTNELYKEPTRAPKYDMKKPIPGTYMWPVIAVATHQIWKQTKEASNNKWASFGDLTNPNYLAKGEQVYVPKLPAIDAMVNKEKYMNIFKYAIQAYYQIPDYDSYIWYWKRVYAYLGGNPDDIQLN